MGAELMAAGTMIQGQNFMVLIVMIIIMMMIRMIRMIQGQKVNALEWAILREFM